MGWLSQDRSNPQVVASVSSPLEGLGQKRMPLCNQGDMPTDPLLHGLYVRSKKLMSFTEITSQVEWKDVNWAKAEWTVFKLQKRIYRQYSGQFLERYYKLYRARIIKKSN